MTKLMLSVLLISSPLLSQDPEPIAVRLVDDGKSIDRSLTLTNSSGKPITAWTVAVEFLRDGKVAQTHGFSGGRYEGESWKPGETLKSRAFTATLGASGAPLPSRLVVDLVVFEDGSMWGPRRLPDSAQTLGRLDGFRLYRLRLKEILQKEGVEGVVRQLSK